MSSLHLQGTNPVLDPRLTQAAQDASLPRSALYPAPEHYTDAYTALHHLQVLQARRAGGGLRPLAVVLQVPFCRALCHHCSRTTLITHDGQRIDRYLDWLEQEIALTAHHLAAPTPVVQLHVGGGTPSQLSTSQLARLLAAVHRHFAAASELSPSLEANPRHLTPRRLDDWRRLGFGGLYVYLPDASPDVQAALGRPPLRQPPATGLTLARQAGFRDIRVELTVGLPRQHPTGLRQLVAALIAAAPDVIRLTPYWHLPHRHPAQRRLATDALGDSALLLASARAVLQEAGWRHLGLDRFAHPTSFLQRASAEGRLRLDCLDYQALPDTDRLGFGLGALSRLGSHHAQNWRQLDDYANALDFGLLPVARGHVMSHDDRVRHALMQALFCQGEVDFATLAEDHLIDFASYFRHEWRELQTLAQRGWVWLENDGFGATAQGSLHLPHIAAVFDRHGRHARQLLELDTP